MTISVAVRVDHLPAASVPATACSSAHSQLQPRTVLVPNLDHHGTVSSIKAFIRANLRVPDELQQLMAPLFTKLSEKDMVEEVYGRYPCHADLELPDLHVDEDSLTFFGREGTRTVELLDDVRLDEYHILDRAALQLKCLPRTLPDLGGRIFVETKDGIIPLLGVSPLTHVSELKQALENMTGIPMAQQLLSSVGRVMHDEFIIKDFDGFHTIFEDSVIDLCKSGDSNSDQGHRRMVIFVSVAGEQDFTLVVQGRDVVQTVCLAVEARTGLLAWQQRVNFSGKVLQDKKTLGEYFVHPECTLQVTAMKTPHKLRSGSSRNLEDVSVLTEEVAPPKPAARKVKLVRTSKGHVKGTLTIPVLTTDTVGDLKRKIRCTLQPMLERSASLSTSARDQFHIDVTPRSSPHPPPRAPSDLSSENPKPVARSLFSPSAHNKRTPNTARSPPSKPPVSPAPLRPTTHSVLSENVSPNPHSSPLDSPTSPGQLPDYPAASPAKMHSLRKLQLKFSGMGSQNQSPKSSGLQWNSPSAGTKCQNLKTGNPLGPLSPRSNSQSQRLSSRSPAPQSQCLSPKSPGPRSGLIRSTTSNAASQPSPHAKLLAQSSSRDLMPELMSLPMPTTVQFGRRQGLDEQGSSSVPGDKTPGKFGAWFNEGIQAMKTLKEQVKVHLDR